MRDLGQGARSLSSASHRLAASDPTEPIDAIRAVALDIRPLLDDLMTPPALEQRNAQPLA
jgi:hypothetical protein